MLQSESEKQDYRVIVNSLGPNIVRSGLMAALTFLQRDKSEAARTRFARDLAEAYPEEFEVPTTSLDDFTFHVRRLDIEDYMLLTRETLKLALWFKRALQAQR